MDNGWSRSLTFQPPTLNLIYFLVRLEALSKLCMLITLRRQKGRRTIFISRELNEEWMVKITFGFQTPMLNLIYFLVRLGQCPYKWKALSEGCLYVSNHTSSWAGAREFCLDQSANMVDIKTLEKNEEIQKKVTQETWIGLLRPKKKTDFEWTIGGVVSDFERWRVHPSSNAPDFTQCALMDTNGFWRSENDCSLRLTAACEYTNSYNVFMLIGPIIIGCGLIVLILSIEVCLRHKASLKKGGILIEEMEENEKAPSTLEDIGNLVSPVAGPPPWRRLSNKTSPVTPPLILKAPTPRPKATPNRSPSVIIEQMEVERHESKPRKSNESPTQEQLELLLSPKNL